MKKVSKILQILVICASIVILTIGCNSTPVEQPQTQPINITILLDLSDRLITPAMEPSQKDRDIAIIEYISQKFKNHAIEKGQLLKSNDHLKIMFYPQPNDKQINIISQNLDINLGKIQPKEKKYKLMEMDSIFKNGLEYIYNSALNAGKYHGSDVWGFFSDKKIDAYCIEPNSRNILVILTDGYLYEKGSYNSRTPKGKEHAGFTSMILKNNPDLKLIVERNGLENVEILELEINPKSPNELKKIKEITGAWYEEMGVQKYLINETELTNNVKVVIDNFLGF